MPETQREKSHSTPSKRKKSDLEHFQGTRAQRGGRLPRGFQNVTALEVVGQQAEPELPLV